MLERRVKRLYMAVVPSTIFVGLSMVAISSTAQNLPRGSYIRKPVRSVQALIQQVGSDPLVLKRYARIFRMPESGVREVTQKLHVTTLARDKVMRVYYVHKGEQLGYKVRTIKKGTRVFALPNGTPAMIEVCGNPISSQAPDMSLAPNPKSKFTQGSLAVFGPDQPTLPAANIARTPIVNDLAPVFRPDEGESAFAADFRPLPEYGIPLSSPGAPTKYVNDWIQTGGSPSGSGGSIVVPTTGGGGGGGGGGIGVVPEPGKAIFAMGVGAFGLFVGRRRRNYSKYK